MTTQRQREEHRNGDTQKYREWPSMTEEQQPISNQEDEAPLHVCTTCNLCCDGSLFNRVSVSLKEKERLKEKARFYTKTNGEIRMRLGCEYLGANGYCECYERRPRRCRSYQCELLRSVEAGITSMASAISIAEEARILRDKSNAASQAAIIAGGGTIVGKEDVNVLIKRVEEQLNLSAPIPAPAVALAKYRYRCFVEWIRLHIKSDHLR